MTETRPIYGAPMDAAEYDTVKKVLIAVARVAAALDLERFLRTLDMEEPSVAPMPAVAEEIRADRDRLRGIAEAMRTAADIYRETGA